MYNKQAKRMLNVQIVKIPSAENIQQKQMSHIERRPITFFCSSSSEELIHLITRLMANISNMRRR